MANNWNDPNANIFSTDIYQGKIGGHAGMGQPFISVDEALARNKQLQDMIAMEGSTELGQITLRKVEDGYIAQIKAPGRQAKMFIAETVSGAVEKAVAGLVAMRMEPEPPRAETPTGYTAVAAANIVKQPSKLEQLAKSLGVKSLGDSCE